MLLLLAVHPPDDCFHYKPPQHSAAACRQLAASFLLAAARLLGGLLEQLANRSIKLHSISLMDAMLAAHAATCVAVESLVATKGVAQGSETMLQVKPCLRGCAFVALLA